tara:strand:- start:2419 stop:3867 length:1449 start_codon:yes stop_codon:yes gene_type:complete
MNNIIPVILCGGSGTRLWPFSREGLPKQFINFIGNKTLFQKTILRIINSVDISLVPEIIIVTNEEHRFFVLDQLNEINIEIPIKIIVEPEPKNTAPALIMASIKSLEVAENAVLLVTPADQIIVDEKKFKKTLSYAIDEAKKDSIVTLGIKPDRPETQYGYIKFSPKNKSILNRVVEFKEKPDETLAKKYLNDGSYFWNSGLFILNAKSCNDAFSCLSNELYQQTKMSIEKSKIDDLFIWPDKKLFKKIIPDSIDYSLMEKCVHSDFNLYVIKLDAEWNDLGLWSSIWNVTKNNKSNGNAIKGNVITHNTSDSLIYSSKRLVTTLGLKDTVVVETSDAILVADMNESPNVKDITNLIKSHKKTEHILHSKVHRPWGWYDSIETGNEFQVKRISVKPGAKLSLQSHKFRSEHWTVIKGQGEVTVNENVSILSVNESIYIPLGAIHRLCNLTDEDLEIIEVQIGTYLGEDDIQRYDDTYGRLDE